MTSGAPASRLSTPVPSRTLRGAAIASLGVSLPERVVDNAQIAAFVGRTPEWIERRTGIRSRRIAGPGETLTDHAVQAGQRALARAGVAAEELDLVLVATTTADEVLPNAAPRVAHGLGATRAGAMDVGAACTGFLSALAVGTAQIEAGRAARVLVIGVDFMSRVVDPSDAGTAVVFADGAGAALLVAGEAGSRIGPIVLGADGAGAEHIVVPRDGGRMTMRGHETFREAVARLSLATVQATHAAGLRLEEIDLFVYHQANGRILSAVADRLAVADDRVVDCIGEYGNTSAATLPLALAFSEEAGRLAPGDRVLVGAFGAGFTWGAVVVEWGAE